MAAVEVILTARHSWSLLVFSAIAVAVDARDAAGFLPNCQGF